MMHKDFLTHEGQQYKDFVLINHRPIEELQAVLQELVHLPTGAQIMHIANDDPENLFCLSFKTLPSSSNGVAHILEHTVLCGSRKYPVKDPFFSMNRRSLNTFMNALTGSDFTCYPAASQVEKDFYNLLEVYLDAVFHPELKEFSFLQEGCRLEFANPKDFQSHLEFKGIVYNEMKGALSSIETRLWHAMLQALVPMLPYSHNSGGDPRQIPSLTYKELIEFHETYYHPSRCLFFFYGDFPLKKHLDFIAEHALNNAQNLSPLPSIGQQARFTSPITKSAHYPLNETMDLEKKHFYSLGWLTTSLLHQEEVLALAILDSVLMDTDASLLKKQLLASKLCVDVDSFLDIEMTEVPWMFTFRGCTKKSVLQIEKVLFDALETIAKEGIPFHLVESSMHQLEFSRTEIGGDHSPFGLTLFMRSALSKQHGCDPLHSLTVHALFKEIFRKAHDPLFFSPFIEKYLLNNPHRVSLHFIPDKELFKQELAEEQARLSDIKENLTEKQVTKILEDAEKLEEFQHQIEKQKLSCLPKVTLEDVPKNPRDYLLNISHQNHLEILHHETFTNHILYADLTFDLPSLTEDELFDLQLFCFLWPELGVHNRSYKENLEFVHAHTGGVSAHLALHVQAHNPAEIRPTLQLHGKALARKVDKLCQLFEEMVLFPQFNNPKRIEELLKKLFNSLESKLNRNAMRYASQLALSSFSYANHIHQIWYGLTFYQKIHQLHQNLKAQVPLLIERLLLLKNKILGFSQMSFVLSCDQKLFEEVKANHCFGLLKLPQAITQPFAIQIPLSSPKNQARVIPSQVAFNTQAFQTIPYQHPDSPALQVATLLLENKVLHHRIREQGGAYGSGANYNALWGNFYFYSYRDPHIAHTFHVFKNAVEEIANGNFDTEDLEEAKLGMIQSFDTPNAPGSRAMVAYTWQKNGKTLKMRQKYRATLLDLTPQDIQQTLSSHLLPKLQQGVLVTFAGRELLDKEQAFLNEQNLEILAIT